MDKDKEVFTRIRKKEPQERLEQLTKFRETIARRAYQITPAIAPTIEGDTVSSGHPEQHFFAEYEDQELYKAIKEEIGITEGEAALLPEPVALPDAAPVGRGNAAAGEEGETANKAYQYLTVTEKDELIKRFSAVGNKEQRVRECEKYCCRVSYSNREKADLCSMTEPTYKRWKARKNIE
jgi:hypothetical protein